MKGLDRRHNRENIRLFWLYIKMEVDSIFLWSRLLLKCVYAEIRYFSIKDEMQYRREYI